MSPNRSSDEEPAHAFGGGAGALDLLQPGPAAGAILLVEDEEAVRALLREILEDDGYRMLEAENGVDGFEVARRHDGPISLVITDVRMPGMSGPELVRRLRPERPGLSVLYISGFTGDHVVDEDSPRGVAFLPKPFSTTDLTRTVGDILARRGDAG